MIVATALRAFAGLLIAAQLAAGPGDGSHERQGSAPQVDQPQVDQPQVDQPRVDQPGVTLPLAEVADDRAPANTGEPAAPGEAIVICHRTWRSALAPWVDFRKQQGHAIHWLDPASAQSLRQSIQHLVASRPAVRYIVIVGDVPVTNDATSGIRTPLTEAIPTHYVPAPVTSRWGSTRHIATDTPYADLDGDGIPELAVGRLPVSNVDELKLLVTKILDYEHNSDFGLWRRQINLTAGTGNFGPLIDAAIESAASTFITHRIPAAYETDMCSADWRSPYCPGLDQLRAATLGQLRGGAAAWVYMGHGLPDRLGSPGPDGEVRWVLTPEEVQQLQRCNQPPIALLLACYVAAYDAQGGDCLGEQLLKAPGGPVAVIGGTRLTMPYGLTLLSMGILEHWFEHSSPTVGDLLMAAKKELGSPDGEDETTRMLNTLAQLFHPQRDQLAQERLEHLHLMQLLGDPLLTLAHPEPLGLIVAQNRVAAGTELVVRGRAEFEGQAMVDLVCRRDRLTFDPPRRSSWTDAQRDEAAMIATRQRANDHRWNSLSLELPPGEFTVKLSVPASAEGPGHVRIFLSGHERFATGAIPLEVVAAPVDAQAESQPPGKTAPAGSRADAG